MYAMFEKTNFHFYTSQMEKYIFLYLYNFQIYIIIFDVYKPQRWGRLVNLG